MKIIYQLIWFDKKTDEYVGELEITDLFIENELKTLVGERGTLIDTYPLTDKQFDYIQQRVPKIANADKYDFFLGICGDWELDLNDAVWIPSPPSTFTNKTPINRIEARRALLSEDPEQIHDALIRITFFDAEPAYIERVCLDCLDRPELKIQREAIECLGHLARMHGKLNKELVFSRLKALHAHPDLKELIDEQLSEIETYLKVKRKYDDEEE